MALFYWLPAIGVLLHCCEEFAWPGGFLAWYRRYRPEFAASLTVRFVVIVNSVLLLFTVALGMFGPGSSRGPSAWLIAMAALATNALFHVRGALATKSYSPGIVTGVLLYVPIWAWATGRSTGWGFRPSSLWSRSRSGRRTSSGPPPTIVVAPVKGCATLRSRGPSRPRPCRCGRRAPPCRCTASPGR